MKHAYLMIVHNNFEIVERTIKLIDNPKNDIYIHVDKKVNNFDFEYFSRITKYSKVYFTERIKVYWGHYTQIESELLLLKAALNQKYDYYHLISGVDLPIKTQSEIHDFFKINNGKEFISFDQYEQGISEKIVYERIGIYRFFSKFYRNPYKLFRFLGRKFDRSFCIVQNLLKFNRNQENFIIKKGANWFSITHNLATYVIKKEKWIENNFKHTFCADELFLQSMVYNSSGFMNNVNDYMRSIDWERGSPYTYRETDVEDLLNSENLFARKFSWETDSKAVDKIYALLILNKEICTEHEKN